MESQSTKLKVLVFVSFLILNILGLFVFIKRGKVANNSIPLEFSGHFDISGEGKRTVNEVQNELHHNDSRYPVGE